MRIAWCDTTKVSDVAPLLPANYKVIGAELSTSRILIAGTDNAGWTLDGYVIPRLGSALIYTEEVK
jgi:hypothetical protein